MGEVCPVSAVNGPASCTPGRSPIRWYARPDAARNEGTRMAEIVKRDVLPRPGDDGWKCVYEIRRDDGCTRVAQAIAGALGNAEALASMDAMGGPDVVGIAEKVQSPARRGRTLITVYYDSVDRGTLHWNVQYERDFEGPVFSSAE
jgi:hypothetical protein